jgi:short-subunit dehydrogenase
MNTPLPLVLITGASSGIGQAIAKEMARRGYRLALLARRAAEIEQWIQTEGLQASAQAYAADVSELPSIAAAAAAVVAAQGQPDIVVASAGISVGMETAEVGDLEVMRRTYLTNNIGLAATFQPFLAAMRTRGHGTLVGVASVAGIRGLPGHGAYCSSKAGVISYCESLRTECHASGVHVVTLVPGFIDTPLTKRNRYRMPFLMPVEQFASQACEAMIRGDRYRVIPWQMGWLAKLLRCLPNSLYDRVVQGRQRKRREGE